MRIKSYAEMRAEGLCTKCGNPNPTPDKSTCPECAKRRSEQKKIRYEYMKRMGKCVKCGKNNAEPSKVLCLECAGKGSDDYYLKYRERKLEKEKIHTAKRTEYRRNHGLCVSCGKRLSEMGLCDVCKGYQRRYRDSKRTNIMRSERVSYGICYICGKNPVLEGRGVCEECYEIRVRSMKKCIESRKSGFNEYWKRDNQLIFR